MKKIITFVAVIAFTTTAFSQVSIHGGGNISQLTGVAYPSSKFGGQIGITTFSNRLFSIQPGIFLIGKGGRNSDGPTRLNYIQVPVNMVLGYNVNENLRLSLAVGLYCSFGLWGSAPAPHGRIDFWNDVDDHRFIDFGGQIMLSGQMGRYGGRIGFHRGFTSVINSARNSTFTFGVSYTFGNMDR
ncbi:MAG: hypothetical protein FWC94_03500 [Bacteroidales bacterium]|nr:hypothetical protein [Bacteroidales bacterium]